MSLLPMWLISCASTPSSSVLFIRRKIPEVTATTACSASLPVAKALGWGESTKYILGLGKPAVIARFSTMLCKSTAASFGNNFAPVAAMTILSEYQYEIMLVIVLNKTANINIPGLPYILENTQPTVLIKTKKMVI